MALITEREIDEKAVSEAIHSFSAGALLTFSGVVRNHHLGRTVTSMEYHAYPSMAEKELARIEEEVKCRWPAAAIAIVHRIGLLKVGETSVYIAVSSPHRSEGFDALRFAIESIKKNVPIWKKEVYTDGHAWIEGS